MKVGDLISFLQSSAALKDSLDREVLVWCPVRQQPVAIAQVTFRVDGTVDIEPEDPA